MGDFDGERGRDGAEAAFLIKTETGELPDRERGRERCHRAGSELGVERPVEIEFALKAERDRGISAEDREGERGGETQKIEIGKEKSSEASQSNSGWPEAE